MTKIFLITKSHAKTLRAFKAISDCQHSVTASQCLSKLDGHNYSDSIRLSGVRPLSELSRPRRTNPSVLIRSSDTQRTIRVVWVRCFHAVRVNRALSHSSSVVAVFCLSLTMLSELSKPVATTPASSSSRLSRSSLARSLILGIMIAVTFVKSL